MNRPGLALIAIATLIAACWTSGVLADEPSGDPMKHNDGTPDGRLVIGDSAEAVRFTLPKEHEKIAGVRIHSSRYGGAEAPKEKVVIYILNSDCTEILNSQLAPYSLFEVGPEKWVDVKFQHPVEVPKDFWVLLDSHNTDPRSPAAKGVFVSYDKSTGGKFSKMGLPWLEFRDVPFPGDWMFELIPAK